MRSTPKLVAAHAAAHGITAGQQRRAAGRADFRRRVEIGKPHALRRHPIQIRRANDRVPVAAEITPAEIVGVDDDDVRAVSGEKTSRRGECGENRYKGTATQG